MPTHAAPDLRHARRRTTAAALLAACLGTGLPAAAAGPVSATSAAMNGAATAGAAATDTAALRSAVLATPGNPAGAGLPWDVNSASPGAQDSGLMYETFAPDGSITLRRGGPDHPPPTMPVPARFRHAGGLPGVPLPVPAPPVPGGVPTLIPMHANGRHDNRIDLIFIGDGYLASEMPVFARSAENAWQALMSYEPYKTYQNFFNASRIEIPSLTSGISNDPTDGVTKVTPLGMRFWCHAIERLLCVNTTAANAYATIVPGVNHVIAIAHTTTYGGAGGAITTLAGENQYAAGVIVHEMAHTIGGLGDEYQVPYDKADGDLHAYGLANVTPKTADQMLAAKVKWWRWLGKPSPDGSTVGDYPGANYYAQGYYRPSQDSEMRSLGQPFNPPSTEALIESFYVAKGNLGSIDPIDSATPVPDATGIVNRDTTVGITTIPLVGRDYTVYWGVGGTAVPGSLGRRSLNLATAPLVKGKWNQVSVYVIDDNPAVLDSDFRAQHMTKSRMWWVWGG